MFWPDELGPWSLATTIYGPGVLEEHESVGMYREQFHNEIILCEVQHIYRIFVQKTDIEEPKIHCEANLLRP